MIKTISTDKARAAWGEPVPDWIAVLAAECDRTSQGASGKRLRRPGGDTYSGAVVNQVLGKSYVGNVEAVEAAVRAGLMTTTISCPLHGEISPDDCDAFASAPMPMSGAAALRAWQACRGCPNSRLGGSHDR